MLKMTLTFWGVSGKQMLPGKDGNMGNKSITEKHVTPWGGKSNTPITVRCN